MAKIISNNSLEKHLVNKYNFKIIPIGASEERKEEFKKIHEATQMQNTHAQSFGEADSSTHANNPKDSLIESLMQKTEEMSSNFIKLQMKLEDKEEEHQAALKAAKEAAFIEGLEAGKAEVLLSSDKSKASLLEQFSSSVKILNESAKNFESSLELLKNELVYAALDISKEVIKVELSQNSSEVAKLLSDELIKDLQGASKITLRVNPVDHGDLSLHVGKLGNIDVISDRAVMLGGVIVMSDGGNIDAQISKRFERVKKAVLNV